MYNFIRKREWFPLYCLILGTIASVQWFNIVVHVRAISWWSLNDLRHDRWMERDRSLSLSLFIFSMIESGSTTFAEWFHGDCDNGERGRCISCFIYTRYTHKENMITLPERVESELQFTMEKQDKNFRTPRWLNQKILILISSTWSNSFGEKSLRGWNQILEFHHVFWINTISPIFFIIIYLLYFKDFTFSLLIEFI